MFGAANYHLYAKHIFFHWQSKQKNKQTKKLYTTVQEHDNLQNKW